MFHCTSIWKLYTLGASLHIYRKAVHTAYLFTEYFTAHLSKKCVLWVFHCISIWKMCGLGISLHIYLKDILCTLLHICLKHMHPDNVHTHLGLLRYLMWNRCTLGIASTEYVPAHLSGRCVQWILCNTSLWNICILAKFTCTAILKMYLLPISYTSILKMCAVGISLHIYVSWAFPTHPC